MQRGGDKAVQKNDELAKNEDDDESEHQKEFRVRDSAGISLQYSSSVSDSPSLLGQNCIWSSSAQYTRTAASAQVQCMTRRMAARWRASREWEIEKSQTYLQIVLRCCVEASEMDMCKEVGDK